MTVSSTVVAFKADGQVEIRYGPETAGVNRYQTLRERSLRSRHSGEGSPLVVAKVMSRMEVRNGKGPAEGIISAPAHVSLPGAAAKRDLPTNGEMNTRARIQADRTRALVIRRCLILMHRRPTRRGALTRQNLVRSWSDYRSMVGGPKTRKRTVNRPAVGKRPEHVVTSKDIGVTVLYLFLQWVSIQYAEREVEAKSSKKLYGRDFRLVSRRSKDDNTGVEARCLTRIAL